MRNNNLTRTLFHLVWGSTSQEKSTISFGLKTLNVWNKFTDKANHN